MTTSSDNKTPPVPRPEARYWQSFSEQLVPSATEMFAQWMDSQLAVLESSQKRFVTRQGFAKSLRR